jgi:hypothetical protein
MTRTHRLFSSRYARFVLRRRRKSRHDPRTILAQKPQPREKKANA